MLESRLRATNSQLEQQMQENMSLRSTISTQSSNCLALESDNRALKMKIEVPRTRILYLLFPSHPVLPEVTSNHVIFFSALFFATAN
jgi:hypothetical protein